MSTIISQHGSLSRLMLLCILVGILFGLGCATFYYAKGHSYLSSDPAACVNCHVMRPQFDGWQKSSHHTVAVCADCHMPHSFFGKYITKAENGYLHSKAFTLQDYPDAIQIREKSLRITNQACLHCHKDLTAEISGHKVTDTDPRMCSRCHANVGH